MTRASIMSRRAVLGLLLTALTLAAYGRTLGHDFISLDDRQYVVENPRVTDGLTPRGALWAFTSFHQANWHPLTWLSHQLDAQLFGLSAGGHHATSLLLHAAGAVALLLALEALTGALWPSFAVAGLFALHPLHVESVAWVAERKDVLSGLFWMLVLGAHVRFARRPTPGRRAAVVVLFALGLLAKPMLVTLPFVLLLLDWWPLGRFAIRVRDSAIPGGAPDPARALVLEKLPLLALAAASCVVTLLAQRAGGAIFPLPTLSVATRVGNAALSYARYLGKTLWPADLSIFYPHPGHYLSFALAGAAGALLLAVTALALRLGRRRPWLAVGWLWYGGTLVPVIGLVQAGNQALADRYTYLPLVGIFLAAVWELAGAARRHAALRLAAPWAGAAVLLGCAVATAVQAGRWRDTISIFDHAVRVTPGINWVAEANLGYEYQRRGEYERSLSHFRTALRLHAAMADLHAGAAIALAGLGKDAEAEAEYREALRIDPRSVEGLFGAGYALFKRGRNAEAAEYYRRALEVRPDYYEAAVNLANALSLSGDAAGASAQYERAIALRPDDPRAHYNFGAHLVKLGRAQEAAAQFRRTIELDPGFWAGHNALGNVLLRQGRAAEAIPYYERALRLNPAETGVRANLNRARAMVAGN